VARPGRLAPLRMAMVVCCTVVVVNGCGTDTEHEPMARGDVVTHWPWDEHPPSTPSPDAAPSPDPTDAAPTSDPVTSGEPSTEQTEDDTPSAGETAAADLESEVVALTDQIRADQGCAATLDVDERLTEASRVHSADMAERDYFDHETPEGDGPADRAGDAGYDAWGGENIAVGYATAREVVDAWMRSKGHRANIVNCGYVAIGVGAVPNDDGTLHWTQSFGWE